MNRKQKKEKHFKCLNNNAYNINAFSLLEYYEEGYYPTYDCNVPLLETAAITATSSLRERGPNNARLNGKDYSFYLFIFTR